MTLRPLLLAAAAFCAACSHTTVPTTMTESGNAPLRLATYNVSLYTEQPGGLVAKLQAGSEQAADIAAVLQRVRPDIVLINEFDYVADGAPAGVGRAGPGGTKGGGERIETEL